MSWGPQLGLRVAGEVEAGGGVRLGLVWAAFPRAAAKGCVLGRQLEEEAMLEEEAELEACRGVTAT